MQNSKILNITERIIACLTYPSCCLVGLIWLILSAVLFKKLPKPITLYHIYQSIFLWMVISILTVILSFFSSHIIMIPLIGPWVGNIIMFFNTPIYFGLSIINLFITIIILYLMLCALLGRYSNLPFVSKIIKQNMDKTC